MVSNQGRSAPFGIVGVFVFGWWDVAEVAKTLRYRHLTTPGRITTTARTTTLTAIQTSTPPRNRGTRQRGGRTRTVYGEPTESVKVEASSASMAFTSM